MNSVRENQNNKVSVSSEEIIDIVGTPFRAVKISGMWWAAFGNNAVSPKIFYDVEELIQYVNDKPWEVMLTCVQVLIDEKFKKYEEKEKDVF